MKQAIGIDSLKLTISKIITMTIALISTMLLSRFRTLEEYGTYSQLLLVTNLITTIFMMGLPKSINLFLARAESIEEQQNFLSTYYTISSILSFIVGLVLVVNTSLIIKYFNNPLIKNFMYVLFIFPWTNIILSSIENILVVYGKTKKLIIFKVLNSLFLLIIIVIVEVFKLGFSVYMMMFIFVQVIFALSVYFIVNNISNNIRFSLNKTLIREIFSFSIPIGIASVIGVLSVELDKLIIGKFFSTEKIAIYTNAARELPITIIASSLTAVLMPHLVRLLKEGRNEEAVSLWADTIILSYIFICFFAIGVFTYSNEVISLLYSDKFLPGIKVFKIYNIILLLRCTYFGIILNSIGKTKFILYSSIASLGLNVILNFAFYYTFGFIGPAIATFVSISIVQILQLIATSKSINISFARIFPWKKLGVITLVNIGMAIIFYYIKVFVPLELYTSEIIESVLLGVIWGIAYIIIMRKMIKEKWDALNN